MQNVVCQSFTWNALNILVVSDSIFIADCNNYMILCLSVYSSRISFCTSRSPLIQNDAVRINFIRDKMFINYARINRLTKFYKKS